MGSKDDSDGRRAGRRCPRTGFVLAACALGLSACVMGPAYVRPGVDVPATYRGAPAGPDASSIADLGWWEVFKDDALLSLLREAVAQNDDLAAAIARVDEARATMRVAGADLYPQVAANASATRTRSSLSLGSGFGPRTSSTYVANLSATWELDLFGRVANAQEAAFGDYLASEAGRRAALVTLVGDVAEGYVTLRELDRELAIATQTFDSRRETSGLFQKRLESGVSSNLETSQASADLAESAAAVSDLRRRVTQQENFLSFLLGRAPGPIARGGEDVIALAPVMPSGVPCGLLERRPDVIEAEMSVFAANARIGEAYSAFFPTVSVTSLLGFESHSLNDLLKDRSQVASIGGSLVAPIFQGGRLAGNRDLAWAQWEESVALYRKAVHAALRDVADQLAALEHAGETRRQLAEEVKSLHDSVDLSTKRYTSGLAAYFEVLDAQRRLFPAQIALAQSERDERLAVVRLYRALGGGWREDPSLACGCAGSVPAPAPVVVPAPAAAPAVVPAPSPAPTPSPPK